VKPGELERNLSRLVEVARAARERLAVIERELAELRHDMENLAAQQGHAQAGAAEGGGSDQGESTEPGGAEPGRGASRRTSAGTLEGQGVGRRDPAVRVETDRSGREVGSE